MFNIYNNLFATGENHNLCATRAIITFAKQIHNCKLFYMRRGNPPLPICPPCVKEGGKARGFDGRIVFYIAYAGAYIDCGFAAVISYDALSGNDD